ncbi:hypothetical protein C7S16_7084 [Burkholderia thailandensis]|uniref:Uncharacterized protein n=2 Tax=Burkholderia thailandensis TaxID=57975 RepID=A0AAW9CRL4_BURTH|nr:hypothetical protein BTH_II1102 [Burkholderia thailandensis E264]MDW9237275.1 hypothetical protein [Burkholderia thailandensis]MDW9252486.1 hypothetical protein [Burkholderia thailandensis]
MRARADERGGAFARRHGDGAGASPVVVPIDARRQRTR